MPSRQAKENKMKKREWRMQGINSQYALKAFLIKLGIGLPKYKPTKFRQMVFMGSGLVLTADSETQSLV